MFARLTIVQAPTERVDETVSVMKEEVIPRVTEIPGLKGGYWFVDRATGRGGSLTFFESPEALRASEEAAAKLRAQATGQVGASVVSVEQFEVVAHIGDVPAGVMVSPVLGS